MAVDSVLSTFPAIDTVVDNIKICAGLENIARIMRGEESKIGGG